MILENERYHVTISIDTAFSPDSYDCVLNPGNLTKHIKVFRIEIDCGGEVRRAALVGSWYSCETDCAVLTGDHLLILLDEALAQIELAGGKITRYVELDSFGTNFSIYECPAGYLIHGEIEITMLDPELEKLWTFSGRDIFVTRNETPVLELRDDHICLRDWDDNYYELDYFGELLTDIPS